jgi:hypothetical protein
MRLLPNYQTAVEGQDQVSGVLSSAAEAASPDAVQVLTSAAFE